MGAALLMLFACTHPEKGDGAGDSQGGTDTTSALDDTAEEDRCADWVEPGPITDPASGGPYLDVSAGNSYSCAIRADHTLACWGTYGGNEMRLAPVWPVTDVEIGGAPCVLDSDGYPTCWSTVYPLAYEGPDVPLVTIESGASLVCGLDAAGAITCWGEATRTFEGTYKVLGSTAGGSICAVTTDGGIECQGYDYEGTVALNEQLSDAKGDFVSLAVSYSYSVCALDVAGYVTCWGEQSSSFPPSDVRFLDVVAAGLAYCAITADYAIECWGDEPITRESLQDEEEYLTPVPCGKFSRLSAYGGYYACGIRLNGNVDCWGYNNGTIPG